MSKLQTIRCVNFNNVYMSTDTVDYIKVTFFCKIKINYSLTFVK